MRKLSAIALVFLGLAMLVSLFTVPMDNAGAVISAMFLGGTFAALLASVVLGDNL